MLNPFEVIDARLSNIEALLLDLKHPIKKEEPLKLEEDLMTVEQVAVFLDLTIPTIYSKTSRRELPFLKRGKRLYFSREKIMEYLKQGSQKTYAEIENSPEDYLKTPRRKRA